MDVIVEINVFYPDPQARCNPADVTSGKFKIAHHCITSSLSKMQTGDFITTDDCWRRVAETRVIVGVLARGALCSARQRCAQTLRRALTRLRSKPRSRWKPHCTH